MAGFGPMLQETAPAPRPVIVRARPPPPRAPSARHPASVRDTNPRLRLTPLAALRVFRDLIAQTGIGRADANRLLDLAGHHPALRDAAALSEVQPLADAFANE